MCLCLMSWVQQVHNAALVGPIRVIARQVGEFSPQIIADRRESALYKFGTALGS